MLNATLNHYRLTNKHRATHRTFIDPLQSRGILSDCNNSMKHEEIRMTLSILEMGKFKAIITLKKRAEPIIAKVKDFEYK